MAYNMNSEPVEMLDIPNNTVGLGAFYLTFLKFAEISPQIWFNLRILICFKFVFRNFEFCMKLECLSLCELRLKLFGLFMEKPHWPAEGIFW